MEDEKEQENIKEKENDKNKNINFVIAESMLDKFMQWEQFDSRDISLMICYLLR